MHRSKVYLFGVLASLYFLSFSAHESFAAGRSNANADRISATYFYSSYTNTGLSPAAGGATGAPTPSLDFELAIRLQTIFNLTLVWTRFQDPDPNNTSLVQDELGGLGLGMKIDMPGFFFIGGKKEQSSREGKLSPVNSFMFGEIYKLTTLDVVTGAKATSTTPRYGFGFDIFPWEETMYVSGRVGILSLLGASYFNYAWGLGFRF